MLDFKHVTCGSVVKLLNVQHNVRLHSHEVKYGSGSGQQVFLLFPNFQQNSVVAASVLFCKSLLVFRISGACILVVVLVPCVRYQDLWIPSFAIKNFSLKNSFKLSLYVYTQPIWRNVCYVIEQLPKRIIFQKNPFSQYRYFITHVFSFLNVSPYNCHSTWIFQR